MNTLPNELYEMILLYLNSADTFIKASQVNRRLNINSYNVSRLWIQKYKLKISKKNKAVIPRDSIINYLKNGCFICFNQLTRAYSPYHKNKKLCKVCCIKNSLNIFYFGDYGLDTSGLPYKNGDIWSRYGIYSTTWYWLPDIDKLIQEKYKFPDFKTFDNFMRIQKFNEAQELQKLEKLHINQ